MNEMTVEELKTRREAGRSPLLLDVREADELQVASIDGATWIPMSELPQRLAELPKEAEIAVMCHLGGRSARVVAFLVQQGYQNVANLTGGIDAWARQIDPSIPTYN